MKCKKMTSNATWFIHLIGHTDTDLILRERLSVYMHQAIHEIEGICTEAYLSYYLKSKGMGDRQFDY